MAETLINKTQASSGIWTVDNLQAGDNISITKGATIDYTVVGAVSIATDGQASAFSTSSYINAPDYLSKATTLGSFEYVTAVYRNSTTSDGGIYTLGDATGFKLTSSYQNRPRLRVSFNGSSYAIDIEGSSIGSKIKTWIKITYSSIEGYAVFTSTDGETWTQAATHASTSRPYQFGASNLAFLGLNGTAPFGGSIYLNDTYLNINGERVWDCLDHSTTDVYNINSTIPASYLQNTAVSGSGLTINGTPATGTEPTNIGTSSSAGNYSIALGNSSNSSGGKSIAIGGAAEATGEGSIAIGAATLSNKQCRAYSKEAIAIGYDAESRANYAVQIGAGENYTASSLKFRGTQIVNANGKIPAANLDTAIPTVDQTYSASSTNAQSGVAVASAISAAQQTWTYNSGTENLTIS